jgi:hypothetical protein
MADLAQERLEELAARFRPLGLLLDDPREHLNTQAVVLTTLGEYVDKVHGLDASERAPGVLIARAIIDAARAIVAALESPRKF